MATITPGYVATDGAPFSPSGWNGDIYAIPNGASVYGEANGNIQDANFAVGQQIDARHVRPFEGFRSEFSGGGETLDFHEALFGAEYLTSDYLPVPGACLQMYFPWVPTVAVFRASCFVTNFRMREGPATGDAVVTGGPDLWVALFVDNQIVESTRRRLPKTYYPLQNPGDANYLRDSESAMTHHFDLMEMLDDCPAGDHNVSLRVLVVQNLGTEMLYALYSSAASTATSHSVTHRIRAGIRSASIIGLY